MVPPPCLYDERYISASDVDVGREVNNLPREIVPDSEFEATAGNHLSAVEGDIAGVWERLPDEDETCNAYEIVAHGALPRRLEIVGESFCVASRICAH